MSKIMVLPVESRDYFVMALRMARLSLISLVLLAILFFPNKQTLAHCDGLDGPVVQAARKALESGNVNFVLPWVRKNDETEIKDAFRKTLAVRTVSPEARDLADTYFFETVVRIHRSGEGEAFTGLKPAGRDLGPAIPAADKAIENGSDRDLINLLTDEIREGIEAHFMRVLAKKNFNADHVKAGREYVKDYVEFIHYVERMHEAAQGRVHGHYPEAGAGGENHANDSN
ncbi:MAG TPA: DUF6448 family protein [bacterium]|nr:DUF6448 family protein [bacterium]